MKLIRTEDAVGHVLCHDLTQIIKDQYKDARFRKGHVVAPEDIPVLLGMGKEHLYVWEMTPGMLHEDEGAERLLALCANENMERSGVKEGKIELKASCDGLFLVRSESLRAVNAIDELMIATRKGGTAVKKGDKLAGMRVIPLIIAEEKLTAAKAAAGDTPLLELRPWVRKTAAIVATGSEVKKGLIQDTFTPVVKDKLSAYGIETISVSYSGDGVENVAGAISQARQTGAEVILCTGGMIQHLIVFVVAFGMQVELQYSTRRMIFFHVLPESDFSVLLLVRTDNSFMYFTENDDFFFISGEQHQHPCSKISALT